MKEIEQKIIKIDELARLLKVWRFKGDQIVFTNGCFDILHLGHAKYLAQARKLGNKLIVGLNSDASVKRLKGPERPINNEYARAFLLASLSCVDAIVLFEEDTPINLFQHFVPDILVKGGDYSPEQIVGKKILEDNGGKIVIIPFVASFSTTETIDRLKKSQ